MAEVEDHVHVWQNYPSATFYCEAEDACPTQLSAADVTARLNFWLRLEEEDWKRRLKGEVNEGT